MKINAAKYSLPSGIYPQRELKPQQAPRKKFIEGRFLRGPIPWAWLQIAGSLPGKSLHVAVVLWFLSGIKKSREVTLPNKVLSELGVDRFAKKRALGRLSEAGLITISQRVGRSPVVTILEILSDD